MCICQLPALLHVIMNHGVPRKKLGVKNVHLVGPSGKLRLGCENPPKTVVTRKEELRIQMNLPIVVMLHYPTRFWVELAAHLGGHQKASKWDPSSWNPGLVASVKQYVSNGSLTEENLLLESAQNGSVSEVKRMPLEVQPTGSLTNHNPHSSPRGFHVVLPSLFPSPFFSAAPCLNRLAWTFNCWG